MPPIAVLVALLIAATSQPSGPRAPTSFITRTQAMADGAELAVSFEAHLVREINLLPGPTRDRATAMDSASLLVLEAVNSGGHFEQILTHQSILRRLRPPLPMTAVVAGFGERRRPDSAATERHTGWSFRATPSTQVASAERGVVVWAGPIDGMGMTVIVAHSRRVHTVYSNLLTLGVTTVQAVNRGDIIALGAATDATDRRELYFELRLDGIPVDPESELGRPPSLTQSHESP